MKYLLLMLLASCASTPKRSCELTVVSKCVQASDGTRVGGMLVVHNACNISITEYNGSRVISRKEFISGIDKDSISNVPYLNYGTSSMSRSITFSCEENGR